MPELPEVETTRAGVEPHLLNQTISSILVREPRLRWPVPAELSQLATHQRVESVRRRGKYLLIDLAEGSLIFHLGMSGSLRILAGNQPVKKHDHVDLVLDSNKVLRFTDPRRFGALLWQPKNEVHPLLEHLGPEPLSDQFNTVYLMRCAKNRTVAIKQLIMNAQVVVGVGNIYANEALFRAGIHPNRAAGRISKKRLERLVEEIKAVLAYAIKRGGTTLRDFLSSDGKPGYFAQELLAYGRAGLPCTQCDTPMKELRLGQRSTVYCPKCQR